MTSNDYKKAVLKWSKEIGRKSAAKRLADRGYLPSTVDKILRGKYEINPEGRLAALLIEEFTRSSKEQAS